MNKIQSVTPQVLGVFDITNWKKKTGSRKGEMNSESWQKASETYDTYLKCPVLIKLHLPNDHLCTLRDQKEGPKYYWGEKIKSFIQSF